MKRHKSVWASCPRKSSRGGMEAESPHPTKEELWVSRALWLHAADRVVQPSQEGINKPCTTHRGQGPAWVELSLCFRTGSFYWGKNPPPHHQLPKWLDLNNAFIQVGLKGIIIFFFFCLLNQEQSVGLVEFLWQYQIGANKKNYAELTK